MKLHGWDAIEAAERMGLRLHKYADPTEDARADLTVAEARRVAREDPSLLWVHVGPCAAECLGQTVFCDGSCRAALSRRA